MRDCTEKHEKEGGKEILFEKGVLRYLLVLNWEVPGAERSLVVLGIIWACKC